MSFSDVEERMPFERFFRGKHHFLAFYVQGKMFCYFDIDKFDQCSIKCLPEEIEELAATYDSISRPYNSNPKYWISVKFHGDVPDKELMQLVRLSYEIACNYHKGKIA